MDQNGNKNGSSDNKDMLYLMGGVALMVLGAGLILSNSTVRKTAGAAFSALLPELQGKFGPNLEGIGTDLQRYLKLRSM